MQDDVQHANKISNTKKGYTQVKQDVFGRMTAKKTNSMWAGEWSSILFYLGWSFLIGDERMDDVSS